MAAPWNPPVRAEDFQFGVCLEDYANPGLFRANPTIAAGDAQISLDEGAFANLTNLPSVLPASGRNLNVELTSAEMTADKITIVFHDQTVPPEWSDLAITIITSA